MTSLVNAKILEELPIFLASSRHIHANIGTKGIWRQRGWNILRWKDKQLGGFQVTIKIFSDLVKIARLGVGCSDRDIISV